MNRPVVTDDALQFGDVGSFRFLFSGDSATFDYTVNDKSGSIPLTRIPF